MKWVTVIRAAAVAIVGLADFTMPTATPAETAATEASPQAWHLATIGGHGARARDCYHPSHVWPPSTSCSTGTFVEAWRNVRVVCQMRGQNIRGYYRTTDLWDYIVVEGAGIEGFASDANIDTGHTSRIPDINTCR